jgi:hypothetical protein
MSAFANVLQLRITDARQALRSALRLAMENGVMIPPDLTHQRPHEPG